MQPVQVFGMEKNLLCSPEAKQLNEIHAQAHICCTLNPWMEKCSLLGVVSIGNFFSKEKISMNSFFIENFAFVEKIL